MTNIVVDGNAALRVTKDGKLQTRKIQGDIQFKNMTMQFENLGFFAKFFQNVANSASNVVSNQNFQHLDKQNSKVDNDVNQIEFSDIWLN